MDFVAALMIFWRRDEIFQHAGSGRKSLMSTVENMEL